MRRIRLIVSYDGTSYVGWQTQKNGVSIQSLLELAIHSITGETVCVQGSGRTDSGVHARAQVAHFDTESRMPADKFAFALNTRLPHDVRILFSEETDDCFHARFSAKNKEYRYRLYVAPHEDVFQRRYALHIHTPLDKEKMQTAASSVLGTHDLAAFKSTGTTIGNTIRTIHLSDWDISGNVWTYRVAGNGFLYNTVRILAGTMIAIGSNLLPADAIETAFLSGNRNDAGPTAPANGLTLWRVKYDGFDTEDYIPQ